MGAKKEDIGAPIRKDNLGLVPLSEADLGRVTGGDDLSGVRVHTDGNAASAASSLGALAYTLGGLTSFGGSSGGLVAHEVKH